MKSILVYEMDDPGENDFGTYYEEFSTIEEVHARVSKLIIENKEKIKILCAGELHVRYEYTPIEYAIKVEPKRIFK